MTEPFSSTSLRDAAVNIAAVDEETEMSVEDANVGPTSDRRWEGKFHGKFLDGYAAGDEAIIRPFIAE